MSELHSTPEQTYVHISVPLEDCTRAAVVLAAAVAQFGPEDSVHLILTFDAHAVPSPEDITALSRSFTALECEIGSIPSVTLASEAEAADYDFALSLRAGGTPVEDARAVLALAALGRQRGTAWTSQFGVVPRAGFTLPRLEAIEQQRSRDDRRASSALRTVELAVVLWSPNFWGALETFVRAAQARADVNVNVVLLRSDTTTFTDKGAADDQEFFTSQQVQIRDEHWLRTHLESIDIVALPDPYDGSRPVGLRVPDFAAAGIRLVYLPYATSLFSDEASLRLMNLGLQNLAWRMYLSTSAEMDCYAEQIETGRGHLRCLGAVKNERLVTSQSGAKAASRLRTQLGTKTTVLWTPHWSVQQGGVSTFAQHVATILKYFAEHPRTGLIVRPHPRLLIDLAREGGVVGKRRVEEFRAVCRSYRNIHLDEESDHVPALLAADALISDLSSVITEYLSLNRPVGYLRQVRDSAVLGDSSWLANVVEIDNAQELKDFLDKPGMGSQPIAIQDPTGSGSRIVDEMVRDFHAEVARARRPFDAAVA